MPGGSLVSMGKSRHETYGESPIINGILGRLSGMWGVLLMGIGHARIAASYGSLSQETGESSSFFHIISPITSPGEV